MAVLEGFESFSGGLPDTLNWSDTGSSGQTINQSGIHVTQGSFSCRIQLTDGVTDTMSLFTPEENDFSSYDTISLDIYVNTIGGGGTVGFVTENTEGFVQQDTSGTGAQTLNLDISGFSNKTNFALYVVMSTAVSGAVDIYIDNLVGTGGGGPSGNPWYYYAQQ